MENNKIHVTISLFFEIKDSDIFGGVGEVGYSESKIDLNTADLTGFKLQEYAHSQIAAYADLWNVPEENVRIISRSEYEENTED